MSQKNRFAPASAGIERLSFAWLENRWMTWPALSRNVSVASPDGGCFR